MSDNTDRLQGKPEKFKIQHTWSLKLSYVFAVGLLALLFVDPNKFLLQPDPLEGSIAIVLERSNDVKRKHPRAASWASVKKDDKLYPNSMIFTGKDSFVKIALIDASIINQGPESLLRLRMAKKRKSKKKVNANGDSLDESLEDEGKFEEGSGIALELDGGNIDIETSDDSSIKSLATRDSKIEMTSGTSLSLKNSESGGSSEIVVTKGNASVRTKTDPIKAVTLAQGQKINTKKLREEEEKADQEVVEKIKAKTTGNQSGFGEKYEMKRKGIVDVLVEMGKIIFFLD